MLSWAADFNSKGVVIHAGANFLAVSYEHDGHHGFPFPYVVTQKMKLEETHLYLHLQLENMGQCNMPAGLGLHPYFCKPTDARLCAPNAGLWCEGNLVPGDRFSRDEEIGEDLIDGCFAGWSRTAYLDWPREAMRISIVASEPAHALVIYSVPAAGFVCIEPVTNVNDGFNAAALGVTDTGVRILAPGQTLELHVAIAVEMDVSPAPHPT
jgi:aldose 1-epimerase